MYTPRAEALRPNALPLYHVAFITTRLATSTVCAASGAHNLRLLSLSLCCLHICSNDKLSADEVEEVQALFQEQWCETYISPLKSFF